MLTSTASETFLGRTLLIADADPDVAALLADIFEQLGASVVTARNAEAAASAARTRAFDLAILEAVLPDGRAWDVLEEVQAVRPDLARRTLLVTAELYNTELLHEIHRTQLPTLFKPFDLNDLRDAAADLLRAAEREYALTAA